MSTENTERSGFVVYTSKAEFNASFEEDRWVVRILSTDKNVDGLFHLPGTWYRTLVFQFIDGIDKGML